MTTIAGAVALALVAAVASPPEQRFTVAIVRFDGRLVPIAYWNGTWWEYAWPKIGEHTAGSIEIDRVPSSWSRRGRPVSRSWWTWPAGESSPIPTVVRRAAVAPAHCQEQLVLETDLSLPAPDPVMGPDGSEGRFGVALDDPGVAVGVIEDVQRPDARRTAAARAVRGRIRYLYAERDAPASMLHVIGERPDGKAIRGEVCSPRTLVTGWMPAGEERLVGRRTFAADCDLKGAQFATPLAVIHVAEKAFWIAQDHGWEDEAFVILEVGTSGPREILRVEGGGC